MIIGLPGLYLWCLQFTYCVYFSVIEKSQVLMAIQFFSAPLHYFLCDLFVFKMDYGLEGTALSFNATILFSFTCIVLFTKFTRDEEIRRVLVPFNMNIFNEFGTYLSLTFYGLMLSFFEEWCNQALTIFSGWLGVQYQAAWAIVFTILTMMYFIPMSLGYSISATLGTAIG